MERTEFRRKMYDALFAKDIEIERIWWDGEDKAEVQALEAGYVPVRLRVVADGNDVKVYRR